MCIYIFFSSGKAEDDTTYRPGLSVPAQANIHVPFQIYMVCDDIVDVVPFLAETLFADAFYFFYSLNR